MSDKTQSGLHRSQQPKNFNFRICEITDHAFADKLFILIGKLQIRHLDVLQIAYFIDSTPPIKATTKVSLHPNRINNTYEKNFEDEFFKLVGQYDLNHHQVLRIARGKKVRTKSSYNASNPEKTQRYINPYTGAILVTGANAPHKLLRIWKDQYGAATIVSWLYDEY